MVSMYLFTLILTSILFQLAKAEDDVSVAADSEAFVKRGNWTLITSLDSLGLGGSWLRGEIDESTNNPIVTFSFYGTVFQIYGTVFQGVPNQDLNLSVKLDNNQQIISPYTPVNVTEDYDVDYLLLEVKGLNRTTHVIELEVTAESSPFWLQGITYNSGNSVTIPTPSSEKSEASNPSIGVAKLGGAIGGGAAALLLVSLCIFFVMRRRVRKRESELDTIQARPFLGTSSSGTVITGSGSTRPNTGHSAMTTVHPRQWSPTASQISLPSEYDTRAPPASESAIASSCCGPIRLSEYIATERVPRGRRGGEGAPLTDASSITTNLFSTESLLSAESTIVRPLPVITENRLAPPSVYPLTSIRPSDKSGLNWPPLNGQY